MASSKKTEVTKAQPTQQKTTALARPDDLEASLLADSGVGFEEASRDAYAIPFLRILQDLSPQVKTKMAGYVKGAKAGQIFNTVSQQLFDEVRVIPCHYTQRFLEWVPREKKGGIVATYDPIKGAQLMATAVRDGAKNVLPNGNELMDSREHYVLIVKEDGSTEGALIALSSTGIKVSRRWMSQMRSATIEVGGRMIEPPMFAWSYKLSVEEEANDQGSWYQWVISDRERVATAAQYHAAKLFGATMKSGTVKVDYESLHERGAKSVTDIPDDLEGDNEIDA